MPVPPTKPAPYRVATERFRSLREERQISREEIATRLHCSVSRVTHFELGYTEPSARKVAEFAAALGVRVDDLLVLDDGVIA
jgi:transcriptional regulator with XRE-family HTH domain